MATIARLFPDGELHVKNLKTNEKGFDNSTKVDSEKYTLDEDHKIDDSNYFGDFLSYLFNFKVTDIPVSECKLLDDGTLYVTGVNKNNNQLKIRKDGSIDVKDLIVDDKL